MVEADGAVTTERIWLERGPQGYATPGERGDPYNDRFMGGILPQRLQHRTLRQTMDQNQADLECFQQLFSFVISERFSPRPGAWRLARQYNLATMACVGLGLTGAMQLFGVNELCLITIEDPALVDAYLEFEHARNLQAIAVLGELGVDILRRNGFYETGDFYGPDVLARLLTRRLNAEAEAARRGGMVSSYTVNTGLMPILDHLAALKLDSLFGLDIAFKGVARAHQGALDPGPSSTYRYLENRATRQAVRDVLEFRQGRPDPRSACHP